MPRTERRIKTISGMGGRMEIYHGRVQESAGGDDFVPIIGGILDVGRWQIRHKQITADITHSGSNGALKRAVVARDFQFACGCPWNARDGTRTPQEVLLGFLEQILVGHFTADYNVGLRFYLGDPLNYTDPDLAAYLRAPLAIAEDFTTICDCTGKDVIRVDFAGSGNSLLEGWRGAEQKFPLVDTARPLYNL